MGKNLIFTRSINIFTCPAAQGTRKYERTSAIFEPCPDKHLNSDMITYGKIHRREVPISHITLIILKNIPEIYTQNSEGIVSPYP